MRKTDFERFLELLLGYDRAVPGEMLTENYLHFAKDYVSPSSGTEFYEGDGCAVALSSFPDGIYCYIYQVSDNCAFKTALAQSCVIYEIEKKKHPGVPANLFALLGAGLGGQYPGAVATLHYSRKGEVWNDPRCGIVNDMNEIRAMCEKRGDDTLFGSVLAESFLDYTPDAEHSLMGFRDGNTLAGVASFGYFGRADIAHLCNLYVLPSYRRGGVGTAIVRSAMGEFPDKTWVYQADAGNAPSTSLAESLGFVIAGMTLVLE